MCVLIQLADHNLAVATRMMAIRHIRPYRLDFERTIAAQCADEKVSELLQVSPMGFGTWAWGNQFLWGYSKEMDSELQEVFDFMVTRGINLFDTADSYGAVTTTTNRRLLCS